jgi:hypothetical protein
VLSRLAVVASRSVQSFSADVVGAEFHGPSQQCDVGLLVDPGKSPRAEPEPIDCHAVGERECLRLHYSKRRASSERQRRSRRKRQPFSKMVEGPDHRRVSVESINDLAFKLCKGPPEVTHTSYRFNTRPKSSATASEIDRLPGHCR